MRNMTVYTSVPNFPPPDNEKTRGFRAEIFRLGFCVGVIILFRMFLVPYLFTFLLSYALQLPSDFAYGGMWFLNDLFVYAPAVILYTLVLKGYKKRIKVDSGFSYALIPVYFCAMFAVGTAGSFVSNFLASVSVAVTGSTDITNPFSSVLPQNPLQCVFYMLSLSVFSPILEELIYRKLILGSLRHYGDFFAIIVSSVIFGSMHGNLFQLFYSMLVGIVLGTITVRSNSVIPAMILHILNNTIVSISDCFGGTGSEWYYLVSTVTNTVVTVAAIIGFCILIWYVVKLMTAKGFYANLFTDYSAKVKARVFFSCPTVLIGMLLLVASFIF